MTTCSPRGGVLPRGRDLGGVDHQGGVDRVDDPTDHRGHVRRVVPSRVVDVDVENVRAESGLVTPQAHDRVPVLGLQQLPEAPASRGVHPFADDQERVLLTVVDMGVPAGASAQLGDLARPGQLALAGKLVDRLAHRRDVLDGRTAAAADQSHPVVRDVAFQGFRHGLRLEREVRLAVDQHGQTCVRDHRDRAVPVFDEMGDVPEHLVRAGRAVQTEGCDRVGLECGDHRADVRSEQHRPGGLDGHADHDRDVVGGAIELTEGDRQALIAHLIWRRSWQVSIRKASTPPSRSPRACSR